MQIQRACISFLKQFGFSTKGGRLFTWGRQTKSLGYSVPQTVTKTSVPKEVQGFNNVSQVEMGQNHSALLTTDGQIYTWGEGSSGELGQNNGNFSVIKKQKKKDQSYVQPQLVEFFVKKNLKVNEIALGENHTVALTSDGDVWTWGWGGRQQNFLLDILFQKIGALGHGDLKTRYTPTPIESLRSLPPIKHISSGQLFVTATNDQNELYNWGKGDYGVFGNGHNKSLKLPMLNDYFQFLKKEQNLEIVQLKSCNNYSVALMSDGLLYGWGSNENGQMGITTEIGVEIYETANFPTQVVNENFKDKKIIDYCVGEDIVAILLDSNEVYWSGSKIAYKPEKLPLPSGIGKIINLGVCYRCVVVSTEDGKLYFKNDFTNHTFENLQTAIQENTVEKLFGAGQVLKIGGSYRNRFAIVQN